MSKYRDLYNILAPNYDLRQQNPSTFLLRKKELSFIKKYSNGLVLDLGCGTGYHLDFPENVIGLDISEKQLFIAKSKNKPLIQGNIEQLPIKARSIDVVLCFYSTLNFVDLEKASKEISRILRNGGVVITSPTSIQDICKKELTENKNIKKFRLEGHRVNMRLFSKTEIINCFEKIGFKLIKFDSIFRNQKPRWGNFKETSFFEKLKLKLDFLSPKEKGRIYFFVFEKTASTTT